MSLRMINAVAELTDASFKTHCPLCGRAFARVASSEEHIFPGWLQRHHDLLTKRLTIPNFIGKLYKSVKIRICFKCNNQRFGQLETRLSPLMTGADAYGAVAATSDDDLAIWLGKIFWLLCCKSHSVEDHRTRNEPFRDRILPNAVFPGVLYLGMIERAYAMKKRIFACYLDDPADVRYYEPPFSLYRFRIDQRDNRVSAFDFSDNPVVLGTAIRSGSLGLICLYDGGLHRRWLAHRYAYLRNELLHPNQFAEVVAQMFYDGMVLDDPANAVTYFWNRTSKAVIAATLVPRGYNPYLMIHHDPDLYAKMLGHHMGWSPEQVYPGGQGAGPFTTLRDRTGKFLRYAVTDEEVRAARNDPNQIVIGPTRPGRSRRNGG